MYFQKYEACGNDYVLVDSSVFGELDWSRLAKELCKRRFSVGADGLLVVSSADADVAHARMRIFNSDGSEADMCGNGVRCVAKYVIKNGDKYGISDVDSSVSRNIPAIVKIQTNSGVKAVTWRKSSGGECFSVNMGSAQVGKRFTLAVLDRVFSVIPVDVGNPHAVIFLEESVNDFRLKNTHRLLKTTPCFQIKPTWSLLLSLRGMKLSPKYGNAGSGRLCPAVREPALFLPPLCLSDLSEAALGLFSREERFLRLLSAVTSYLTVKRVTFTTENTFIFIFKEFLFAYDKD